MEDVIFQLWEGLREANGYLPKPAQLKIKPPLFGGTFAELEEKAKQKQREYEKLRESYLEEDYRSHEYFQNINA
jgi:hypothetical protein